MLFSLLENQHETPEKRPMKRMDTLVAKGKCQQNVTGVRGRNFNSVEILLTFTFGQCNVMPLLNNLSGTGPGSRLGYAFIINMGCTDASMQYL